MDNNDTRSKAQALYCQMMADGKGHKAAIEASGLSAYWAAFAWYGDSRNPKQCKPASVKLAVPAKDEDGYEVAVRRAGLVVAELRAGLHTSHKGLKCSWGQIAVICDIPESAVHRYFKAGTGLSSHGTRKGSGGRYLADEPRFYTGNRKAIGVEDEKPRSLDPAKVMAEAEDAKTVLPATVAKVKKQLGAKARVRATKATPKAKA